jgi:hypothetical protein
MIGWRLRQTVCFSPTTQGKYAAFKRELAGIQTAHGGSDLV